MTVPTPVRRKRGTGVPATYDFRQPVTLTREHSRALEVSLTGFGRQWGTLLTSRLGALATVSLESVELAAYGDYIASLPAQTTGVVLQMDPSRTPALLEIPSEATMTLVDCLLGGPVAQLDLPFRELTDIERRLLTDVLDFACTDLAAGLASIGPVSFAVRTIKYTPTFMQLAPATDQIALARFELTLGDLSAPISLMLMAEPVLAMLRAADNEDGRTEDERREHRVALQQLEDRMCEVPLDVAVRFRGREMTAAQISALEVGSVVRLGHRADQPLDVMVGEAVLGHAAIGANGSRAACLVVATKEEE